MTEADTVLVERDGPVTIVSINRPHCRNAVDGATARKLYDAFLAFDADNEASHEIEGHGFRIEVPNQSVGERRLHVDRDDAAGGEALSER